MGDDVIRGEVLEVTRGEVVEVLSAADVLPAAILIDSDPIGTTAAMICMADVQDMDISPPDEYCYSSYTPKKWSEILTVIKVNFRSTELQKKWPISTALLTTDLDLSRVSPKQWSKTGRFLKPVYTKIREELRLREEAEKEGGGEVGPGGWKWRFGSRRRVQREIVKQWSEDLKQSRESLQDASETGDDSTDPVSLWKVFTVCDQ